MTIDEAIAWEMELHNMENDAYKTFRLESCKKFAEEHKQYAEWLEELKDLREIKETIECNAEVLEQQGYDKAIDDFDKWFQDKMQFGYVHIDQWNEYIEQLKEGKNNENN